MPDELNRSLQAIHLQILELGAWRNLAIQPLKPGFFQARDMKDPALFQPGDQWPSRAFPVRITLPVTIPASWKGKPVRLYLDVGGEALLSINGRPVGGLLGPMPEGGRTRPRVYQREYEITPEAAGGETIHVEVEAVPRGRFGVPVYEPRFQAGFIVIPDLEIRNLYEDLLAIWDVAQALEPTAKPGEREFLIDILRRAMAKLRLPDTQTGRYLAALGQAQSVAAMLRTVWDEWDLSAQGQPAFLGEEHRESAREGNALLQEGLAEYRRRFAPEGALALTGHAHLDLAWLWPLAETRRKARRTFSSVLTLMERYPDFVFNQSSAQIYAFVEEDDPELFRRIQARVAEERWEPVGGSWVEMDCNLTSGESLVRQHLYGQRYFLRAFGRKSRVAWLPDTFGFTGALPQILRQAGVEYFFTTKLYWNDRDLFPFDLYWWEGIDGSRVLAHLFRNENQGYNGDIQAFDLQSTWKNFRAKARHAESLFSFGWGDGGGGPTEEMLERYQRLKDLPGLPRSQMSRVADFYDHIDREKPLPIWTGEQYLEFHRGTYTTQGRVKYLNRQSEQRLYEAEALAALAVWHGVQTYPGEALTRAWQTLLRNQFHDILPGSSVHTVYEEAEKELASVVETASSLRDTAAEALARRIPAPALAATTGGVGAGAIGGLAAGIGTGTGSTTGTDSAASAALIIWNLRNHPRRLEFTLTPPGAGGSPTVADQFHALSGEFRLLAEDGSEIPYQKAGDGTIVAQAPRAVDGVGYLSLAVVPGAPSPVIPRVWGTGLTLENEFLRVTVSPDGALASVYDKRAGREVLDGEGNQLVAYSDRPASYDAWDVDEEAFLSGRRLEAAAPPNLAEAGPLRAAIEVNYRRDGRGSGGDGGGEAGEAGARIRQRYILLAGSPRLDIETWLEWTGRRTLLKALFPVAVLSREATFETAYGAVTRPTHRNTSWDQARFEVPAHRWADLSEGGYGVSLLNNGRYGHSVSGNLLGLSLLRSPIYPDPYADEGVHHFTYALYPHPGDWRNGTVDEATALNAPLLTTWTGPEGDLPASQVLLALDNPALQLGSLKLAEGDGAPGSQELDEGALIVRFHEAGGSRGSAILEGRGRLSFDRAAAANLLEEPEEELAVRGSSLELVFKPYQIQTVKLFKLES